MPATFLTCWHSSNRCETPQRIANRLQARRSKSTPVQTTITAVLLAIVLSQAVSSRAERPAETGADFDWPQLRGPTYDGTSAQTKLAESWPAEGPPVLWVRDLGQGYSSFAVVGDRIFTQMQSLFGQYVVCLDAKTGKTIWEHRYGL